MSIDYHVSPAKTISKIFQRTLDQSTFPCEAYVPLKAQDPTAYAAITTIHWGQRKLLLSEIEFLTRVFPLTDGLKSIKYFVYIGAATGQHVPFLMSLFPDLDYHLYDPREFDQLLVKLTNKNLHLYNQYFTDTDAQFWADKNKNNTLLCCDIREFSETQTNIESQQEDVHADMLRQMRWVLTIKPVYSLLKFRCPWEHLAYSYLDGEILFQVWAPKRSTESRLLVSAENLGERIYDTKRYDEQMNYFNMKYRPSYFDHGIDDICHCYDCAAELFILLQYCVIVENLTENLDKQIIKMRADITKSLGVARAKSYNIESSVVR